MKKVSIKKIFYLVIIVALICIGFSVNALFLYSRIFMDRKIMVKEHIVNILKGNSLAQSSDSVWDYNKEMYDSFPLRDELFDINGYLLKSIGNKSFFSNRQVNVADNGYILGEYKSTTTDYEIIQLIDFKTYLDQKGIKFLYVNEPTKYFEDGEYYKEFAKESYINRNMDELMARMNLYGINYLDLRTEWLNTGNNSYDMFYKTDHHWTVPASKWAAEQISKKLNGEYGYNIDESIYNDEQYFIEDYKNSWLGEQGRLVGKSYVGMDDYTLIYPKFDTDYIRETISGSSEGSFEVFLNRDVMSPEMNMDAYDAPSWHYVYDSLGVTYNNKVSDGSILVLGDSFERTLIPFLSLGVRKIMFAEPRGMENSVREIIDAGDFDTVIMAYYGPAIGGRDLEPGSTNYEAFNLGYK